MGIFEFQDQKLHELYQRAETYRLNKTKRNLGALYAMWGMIQGIQYCLLYFNKINKEDYVDFHSKVASFMKAQIKGILF
jgi:hypothetical protein